MITVIDIATHRIVYRYGRPGHPGSAADRLSNPDDAMILPSGDIITADIKNCRLLIIKPGTHRPLRIIGTTTTACRHAPPQHWGSPNGVFPMANGRHLVTEINGDWVDAIGLGGRVYWSTHPPGVAYPSDTNEIAPDRYLTADYSSPGQVVIFDRAGRCAVAVHRPRRQHPRSPVAGAPAAQRRHHRQRRLQPPRRRHRPAHPPDRVAVRRHRRGRAAAGLPEQPGRHRPGATELAAGPLSRPGPPRRAVTCDCPLQPGGGVPAGTGSRPLCLRRRWGDRRRRRSAFGGGGGGRCRRLFSCAGPRRRRGRTLPEAVQL